MKYRKKPVMIEAMQLTDESAYAVLDWLTESNVEHYPLAQAPDEEVMSAIVIGTLEGDMRADMGDWIIRGVQGEFYPCKPDIFEATYEEVGE